MSEQSLPEVNMPDPKEVAATMAKVAEQSQRLVQDFVDRQANDSGQSFHVMDPGVITRTFMEFTQKVVANPTAIIEAQTKFWQDYMALWQGAFQQAEGEGMEPVIAPAPTDRRFKDDAWQENPLFDYIKQSYLLAARYAHSCAGGAEGLDPHTEEKVEFFTRQFVDALAPTNFVASNPQVLRRTMETGGQNLIDGLSNLLEDLEDGQGKLRIRMTDVEKFELGENVAVTPGKVVFQTELMQLIQYEPTTEEVHRRPLLIFPPWINKYYIMDLRPKNSLIKWLVDQGHTVFIMSWVNPDESLADKGFEDYLEQGPLAALDAIEQATGERRIKAIGYCLGGTLLASTLAYMKAKDDDRIKAATFFTTMVDFSEPGELGVFIDEEQLTLIEETMKEKGYFEGSHMAEAFNLLRANDLIWSFVVNNYLMGKDPFPFDLLYWNSDSTRMPREIHSFYLRNMYQNNVLCQPGGVTLKGVPIDLRTIDTPVYMLSTREDHIAPWTSTYAGTQLYSGPIKFVLGASGHIAGVINPPAANKYGYWTNKELPTNPDEWLAGATQHEGSWWTDWDRWVKKYNGKKVPARVPGDGKLDVIEDAPGSYVKLRIG